MVKTINLLYLYYTKKRDGMEDRNKLFTKDTYMMSVYCVGWDEGSQMNCNKVSGLEVSRLLVSKSIKTNRKTIKKEQPVIPKHQYTKYSINVSINELLP